MVVSGYASVGKHSAVKPCLWAKKALRGEGHCYKEEFYGIRSHRCLQMTPAQPFCNLACRHCWRDTSVHNPKWQGEADSPSAIIDGAIAAQRKLLTGFKGNAKALREKWLEAQEPKHAAISLDGEPTLYPMLPELIREFHERGLSTFLVTNGTHPEVLERLQTENALPTQLYISFSSPNEAVFEKNQVPLLKGLWKKYLESLRLMASLKTRRVLRMTLAKGLNMDSIEDYATLVKLAGADYVEVKAYMALGKSRLRLGPAFMPSHAEIQGFGKALAAETGYVYSVEHEPSRVALLCKDNYSLENRLIDFSDPQSSGWRA